MVEVKKRIQQPSNTRENVEEEEREKENWSWGAAELWLWITSFVIIYHWSVGLSVCGLHDKLMIAFWFEPLQILVNDKTASASEIVRSSISQYIICLLFHLLWWCDYRCCTYFRLLLHFMIIVELFLLENAHMARFMNIFHHCCMV